MASGSDQSSDYVGSWDVQLPEGKFVIGFEHGTISGKRVVRVNGKEVVRKDWLFKLVGTEHFQIGAKETPCSIKIEPFGSLSYQYSLEVNGRSYQTFVEQQSKVLKTWIVSHDGEDHRVVLEKDTLDVWVDNVKVDTAGEFFDGGAETHFTVDNQPAYIKAVSSGNRRQGIVQTLVFKEKEVPEFTHNGSI